MDKNNRKNITDAQVEMLANIGETKDSADKFFAKLTSISTQYGLNHVMVKPFPVAGGWLVKSFYCQDDAGDNDFLLLHGMFKDNGISAVATNIQDDKISWLDEFVLQMIAIIS